MQALIKLIGRDTLSPDELHRLARIRDCCADHLDSGIVAGLSRGGRDPVIPSGNGGGRWPGRRRCSVPVDTVDLGPGFGSPSP
ncbi:hypothetical protein [Actinoplanes sp. ATCC 53533]|uniref:hypothetical protein n=1 Tax=Actinoplanes sp. ATCC 53533 TaxID=1288362 RepID=UPI000F773A42|nr:hypothetical protein [Actinoplanes sp. ATCC 53533]